MIKIKKSSLLEDIKYLRAKISSFESGNDDNISSNDWANWGVKNDDDDEDEKGR